MKQHTLKATYSFTGKGIHSGKRVTMTLLPAPEEYGIVFQRVDKAGEKFVKALACNVIRSRRSTCITENNVKIRTPEHILATLYGLGVDNALIQLDNVEVPIMDGSAKEFAEAIVRDGLIEQKEERRFYVPEKPFIYEDSKFGSRIVIMPADEPSFEVEIDFKSQVIGIQQCTFDGSTDFTSQIAPGRTFCFLKEIRTLSALGLIKGGSLDNALVIDEPDGYYGGTSPRFSNECARHKMLDLLGDFALAGRQIKGKVKVFKPGHRFNTNALKLFLETIGD